MTTPSPAQAPLYAARPARARRRVNPLGIAALALAVLGILASVVFFVYAAVTTFSGVSGSDQAPWVVVGVVLFVAYALGAGAPFAIVAVGLGVGSLFLKGRGKVFGIIAIVLATPLALAGVAFIGSAVGILEGNLPG